MSDKRYLENKEEINKKQMVYNKKRYHEDMEYKMKTALRNRMNKCLKIKDVKNKSKNLNMLKRDQVIILIQPKLKLMRS